MPITRLATCTTLLLLIGCSGTRVHLYTEGMPAPVQAELKQAMEREGFKVALNDRPVPAQVKTETLVYSPYHRRPQQIHALHAFLYSLGYETELRPVSVGNNYYTSNNVGLYLVPYSSLENPLAADQPNADNPDTLGGKLFNGACPQIDAALDLNQDFSFELRLLDWDDATAREIETVRVGNWRLEGRELALEAEEQLYAFTVERYEDQMQFTNNNNQVKVSFKGIRLLNTGEQLQGCDFDWRQPVAL